MFWGVIILRNGMFCGITFRNGTIVPTLVYLQTLLVWDCGVIYAATELHIHSLHLIL